MLRTFLLRALLLPLTLWMGLTAFAEAAPTRDQISERGLLADPSGSWTLADVQGQRFTPYRSPYSQGSQRHPWWLKLTVPPQPAADTPLVLLLQPTALRDVQVFTQDATGGWRRHLLGSRHPFSARTRTDLTHSLDLDVSHERPTVIYVRVETHTATIHAEVVTTEVARSLDTQLHLVTGAYVGLALVLALLSIVMWVSTRDILWAAAATFDISTIVHSATTVGLTAKYLLPEAAETLPWFFTLTAATHATAACVMFALLVRALDAPRWTSAGYLLVVPLYLLFLWQIAQGELGKVLIEVNQLGLFMTLWGALPLVTIRTPDRLLAWTYRVFTGALILYLLLWFLPLVQPGPTSFVSLYPTLPTNLVTMVMVTLVLARRTMLVVREQQRLRQEARDAQEAYRRERAQHEETEGLLSMIVHETKNPLASIRVASELLGASARSGTHDDRRLAAISEAVEGIDHVLNRWMDVDRLERGAAGEEQREHVELVAELRQWLARLPEPARVDARLPDALPVCIDSPLFLMMLGNLVDNALKYSPPGSTITLTVRRDERCVLADVRNEPGRAGRPDPKLVFQKYYRATAAQHRSGTGLGLYWVRKVATQVGGRVTHDDDPDHIVFRLEIPA
ncbi:MAG TPA: hypothetical protein DCM32_02605 [Xanthomonadaceae bacterium]|nr:hypothetical protein [Xanthomonadaceae bacterium]